jgi:hypothetical protein
MRTPATGVVIMIGTGSIALRMSAVARLSEEAAPGNYFMSISH